MITRRRWDSGANVVEMLNSAYEFVTDRGRHPDRTRKIRLYLAACCRQFWEELPWICRMTVEKAEQMADGITDDRHQTPLFEYAAEGVMESAWRAGSVGSIPFGWIGEYEQLLTRVGFTKPEEPDYWPASLVRLEKLSRLAYLPFGSPGSGTNFDFVSADLYSVSLLHDVFNPFFRSKTHPSWRSTSVRALAESMYASRDFAAMPILADALEEAGCDQPNILAHCRGPGPHVRGCWVVDLVLGKQ
jgi:hypothetical protein